MDTNPTIRVGDSVTWAYHDEDVGEDEVGVVKVIYEEEDEADVVFLNGDFCLELRDLTLAPNEPLQQRNGYEPPSNDTNSAPPRPMRAYEEVEPEQEITERVPDEEAFDEVEEEYESGDDDVSSASSRRLNFDAHDGDDDGTDYENGVSNDDGAWGADMGAEIQPSNEHVGEPDYSSVDHERGPTLVEGGGEEEERYNSEDDDVDADEEEATEEQGEADPSSKEEPSSRLSEPSPRSTTRPQPSVFKAEPRSSNKEGSQVPPTVTAPESVDSNSIPKSDGANDNNESPNIDWESPATISTVPSSSSSGGRVHEEAETSPREPEDASSQDASVDANDEHYVRSVMRVRALTR